MQASNKQARKLMVTISQFFKHFWESRKIFKVRGLIELSDIYM